MDRQKEVLRQMVSLGYLDQETADKSFDDYWATFDYTRTDSSVWLNRDDKARWFSEYVRRDLEQMMYGTMDLYSGGYTVHTTLDLTHQQAADEVMTEYIKEANKRFQETSSSRFARGDQYAEITELIALTFDFPQLAVSAERTHVKTLARYRNEINPVTDIMSLLCGLDSLKIMCNISNAESQKAQAKSTVEGALVTLSSLSKLLGKEITKEVAKEQIKNYIPQPLIKGNDASIDDIINETANYFNVNASDIKGKSRNKNISMARHISIYLSSNILRYSLTEIGTYFGNMDHTTVSYAINKVKGLLNADESIKEAVDIISSNISNSH